MSQPMKFQTHEGVEISAHLLGWPGRRVVMFWSGGKQIECGHTNT